jgi:hypothetical protein
VNLLFQFCVLRADGKEHFFSTENHESLMVWLMGLQVEDFLLHKTCLSSIDHSLGQLPPSFGHAPRRPVV